MKCSVENVFKTLSKYPDAEEQSNHDEHIHHYGWAKACSYKFKCTVKNQILTLSKLMECLLSGVQGNGGEHHHHPDDHGPTPGHDHDHDHDHGHGHSHGHGHDHGHEEDGEELATLIKSFGVAVLGKVHF